MLHKPTYLQLAFDGGYVGKYGRHKELFILYSVVYLVNPLTEEVEIFDA